MLMANAMLSTGKSFGEVRSKISKKLELLTFARLLWELFEHLIYGVIDSFQSEISKKIIELIKTKINIQVTQFLDQALQLDSEYIESEIKAEAIGAF